MAVVERGDDLGIDDTSGINDEVGNEDTNQFTFVVHVVGFLLFTTDSLLSQLDHEGAFVELFIQAWSKGVEHLHRRADHELGQVGIICVHLRYLR